MMNTRITIPLVDLASQRERQFLVDQEEGQYIGHPSSVLLSDGHTLMACYPKSHGRGPIALKKSYDGGKTWTQRLPVPVSFSTSMETPTMFATVDKQGQRHILLFSGLYPIRMAHSEDDGETWTELTPIGNFGGIAVMGDMIARGNGEYIAFFHDDGRFIAPKGDFRTEVYIAGEDGNYDSRMVYSSSDGRGGWVPYAVWNSRESAFQLPGTQWHKAFDTISDVEGNLQRRTGFTVYSTRSFDGGLTWEEPVAIAHHDEAQLCEPGIAMRPDGKRIAMLLRENGRNFNSFICFSDDLGLTWTEPVQLPASLTGDRHQVLSLPDGRLLISFREMCSGSPTWGDWCGWVGTFEDLEKGREGQYRIRFMDNLYSADCAYPTLKQQPDGTITNITYGHWTEGKPAYVMCVRFTIQELDEMARKLSR